MLPQRDGSYLIANYKDQNYFLDVSNASTENGTKLQLHTRNGNKAQNFLFVKNPESSTVEPINSTRAAVIMPVLYMYEGEYVLKASAATGSLIVALRGASENLESFNFVRARGKGPGVYQIKSNTWPASVLGRHDDQVYLMQNIYADTQFWNLHFHDNLSGSKDSYFISNFAFPNEILTSIAILGSSVRGVRFVSRGEKVNSEDLFIVRYI